MTIARSLMIAALAWGGCAAQAPRPSQHGSVTQRIGETTIAIEYNRPVEIGRAHV